MSTIQLTPAQHAILAYAIEHTSGKIEWFPDHVKGGARTKVLEGLSKRRLVNQDGTSYTVAPEGYDALGLARPAPAPLDTDPEVEVAVAAAEASWAKERAEAKPRTREHSKQAIVIQMLRRPEGATVKQLCEATGWQAHTVRGTFAGAFKKKLGLNLVSDKVQGGDRVYRIA